MAKKVKEEDIFKTAESCHKIWHKFSDWLVRTYGKDLHGEWKTQIVKGKNGKKYKFRDRTFNDLELSRRLIGYDVQIRVERYAKRFCPEIKIVRCDDEIYSSSCLVLVPHPEHGITIIFIPQNTVIQNQFFMYGGHCKMLIKELKAMSYVYKNK